MKSYFTSPYRSQGLSLVELLVALAISSILLLGMSTIYLDSRKTDKLGVALSRIQETGRFAIDFLAKDIRMAGYNGCIDLAVRDVDGELTNGVINTANNSTVDNIFETALRGFEVENNAWAAGTEFDGTSIETDALIGSDVIAIQTASVLNTVPTAEMSAQTDAISFNNSDMGFEQNDIVIIADCENASMFRVSNTPGSGATTLEHAVSANTSAALNGLYSTDAKIMGFQSVVYYVKATGRTNARGDVINALYRSTDDLANGAQSFTEDELVQGVDSIQIIYGERLDSGNLHYVPADELVGTDMTMVESIKIGLLVSSEDRVQDADDNLSYELPGETIAPLGTSGATVTHAIDQRIRRDFSASINLRNRME